MTIKVYGLFLFFVLYPNYGLSAPSRFLNKSVQRERRGCIILIALSKLIYKFLESKSSAPLMMGKGGTQVPKGEILQSVSSFYFE